MTEPISFIPSRVKNCAEGGHVAGARDIIDDGSGITLDELVGNKEYAPADFSGMGRVVLKKNIVNGVNTLTRSMISDANTIYVIQYDFTLDTNIDIPDNCVLKFDGGSISGNGTGKDTITGTNTIIDAENQKEILSINLHGTFKNTKFYVSWLFGNDITEFIKSVLNTNFRELVVDVPTLSISSPILIKTGKTISGLLQNGYFSEISPSADFTPITVNGETVNSLFYSNNCYKAVIERINFNGKYQVKYAILQLNNTYTSNIIRENYFTSFIIAAICVHGTENCIIEKNYIYYCGCGILVAKHIVNEQNLLDFSNTTTVSPNIIKIKGNYLIYNNYGVILNFASDVSFENNSISHCPTWALYAQGTGLLNIRHLYLEGNGHSLTWVDSNGFTNNITSGVIVPQLNNGWGYNIISSLNNQTIPARGFIFLKTLLTVIEGIFISYKYVRTAIGEDILTKGLQNISGVDSIFVLGGIGEYNINSAMTLNPNGPQTMRYIYLGAAGSTLLNMVSIPEVYKNTNPFYQIGNAAGNSDILVLHKTKINNVYPNIFSSCIGASEYYPIKSISDYVDAVIERHGLYYFKIKSEFNNSIAFLIPKNYLYNMIASVKVYSFNTDISKPHNLKIDVGTFSTGHTKELLVRSLKTNIATPDGSVQLLFNYEDFASRTFNDYLSIIINITAETDVYVTIPYLFFPDSIANTYIQPPTIE